MNFIDFFIGLFIFLFVAPILIAIFGGSKGDSEKNQNLKSDNSDSIFNNSLDSDYLGNTNIETNPASGLPMLGGSFDIEGNAYGSNDDKDY
ncbi:hypothetical protein [Shewanella sp. UCD-KL12]|uniref:hypothetical protein n=1 Tax=Shewanella sp. UCD-KL12 TaxID=1917163 RepID=UPI0009713B81|nr:hypothetical protein [Shewanella sp. UCD-KL12]